MKTVKAKKYSRLLVFTYMFGLCSSLHATVTVNGNTITWPDNGWYQVQTADGSETLCNGGSSCAVEPGSYLVINHSTGERFLGIEVSGSVSPSDITVSGSTITWPDNGWYQVQTADGSETLCNGGSSCTVDPGSYLVINHSTDERFRGIEVSGSVSPSDITVNDNTITWPDNGWYQVQTADGSETLCNGGSSCAVEPGSYLVINHSTGERFNEVEVRGNSQGGVINATSYQSILEQMVIRLYAGFYDPAFESMKYDDNVTLVSESSDGIKVEESYACNGGGTYETVDEVGGAAASNTISLKDCLTNGVTYGGNFTSSQTFGLLLSERWDGYEAVGSADDQVRISVEKFDSFNTAVSTSRFLASEYVFITEDSQDNISNMETSVSVVSQTQAITGIFNITVNSGLSTNGVFTLSTAQDFTDLTRSSDNKISTYAMGQLEIVAEDQSKLVIDANNGDPDTFTALIESLDTVTSFTVPWSAENILPCAEINHIDSSECAIDR